MKKKRLVARIIIVICLFSYPLIAVCVNLAPYLNGFHSNLGKRVSTLDGSLYDAEGKCFTVQDFRFGEDLSKTVDMLDLKEWYPPAYVNELVEEMKDSDVAIHELGDNNAAFIAFGGKKYVLSFRLSQDLKCYMLRFASIFEPPKLENMSSLFYAYINHLSYKDSARYFDDLMNAFLEEYGTPTAQQSDMETPENPQVTCSYAMWEQISDEGVSFVQLSARTFDNSSQSTPGLGIYIDIGQTIPGVSVDDLMSYLPNAENRKLSVGDMRVDQSENMFANEASKLRSPSGEYSLSLERIELNNVTSYKIVVTALDGQTIYSDESFRARDTLLVLWDDTTDRIWAYSGDVGTYYWDIYNKSLICHTYADSKDIVVVPHALASAKPNIFGNK